MLFDDEKGEDILNINSSINKNKKRDEELNLKHDRELE